jgi:NitT/TauT family transport system substrate-binding protein
MRLTKLTSVATLILGVTVVAGLQPASAQSMTKISMSTAGVGVFRLPLYIAIHNGYFNEQGLDLQLVDTQSGSDAMKILAGGAVQFSTGQLVDSVNLNQQGIKVRGVFMMTNRLTNSLVVRSDLADKIHSLGDLKGDPLGATGIGSGTWQLALFIAKVQGVDPDSLNFVGVGHGAGVIAAMKSKRVAVISYAEPETLQLVNGGDGKMLLDAGDPATHEKYIGKDYMNNWIMVLKDYADGHPEVVQHFVNAMQEGLDWAHQHSSGEIASLLEKVEGFEGMDDAVLAESVKRQGIPESGVVTQSAFDDTLKILKTIDVLKVEMAIDQLALNNFSEQAAKKLPLKK